MAARTRVASGAISIRPKEVLIMSTGFSLFLIAVGAILYWAVTYTVSGVDLTTIGAILMIVSLLFWSSFAPFASSAPFGRRTTGSDVVVHDNAPRPQTVVLRESAPRPETVVIRESAPRTETEIHQEDLPR